MSIPGRTIPVPSHRPISGRRVWLADRSDGTRLHAGVDLAAPGNTPVLAPEAGVIEERAPGTRPPWTGYGPWVLLLRGDSGRWHLLAHVSEPLASMQPGRRVELGEPVAVVAPELAHLHWEVRTQPRRTWRTETVEISLDPVAWLEGVDRPFLDGGRPRRCPPRQGLRTPRPCRSPRRPQLVTLGLRSGRGTGNDDQSNSKGETDGL